MFFPNKKTPPALETNHHSARVTGNPLKKAKQNKIRSKRLRQAKSDREAEFMELMEDLDQYN